MFYCLNFSSCASLNLSPVFAAYTYPIPEMVYVRNCTASHLLSRKESPSDMLVDKRSDRDFHAWLQSLQVTKVYNEQNE